MGSVKSLRARRGRPHQKGESERIIDGPKMSPQIPQSISRVIRRRRIRRLFAGRIRRPNIVRHHVSAFVAFGQ